MIIQNYWWIIQCNQYNTTQAGAGVLGCERGFKLKLFWLWTFPLWLFRFSIFQISIFIFFFNDHPILLMDHSMQWMHCYANRSWSLRLLFGIRHSHSTLISFFFDYYSILLVDRNEEATVRRGDLCAHVSLRASLSLRSCFSINHFVLTWKC